MNSSVMIWQTTCSVYRRSDTIYTLMYYHFQAKEELITQNGNVWYATAPLAVTL